MKTENIPPLLSDMIHMSIYTPAQREWARAEFDAAVDQMIAESEGRGPYLNQAVQDMLALEFKGASPPQPRKVEAEAAAGRAKLRYSYRSGALERIA